MASLGAGEPLFLSGLTEPPTLTLGSTAWTQLYATSQKVLTTQEGHGFRLKAEECKTVRILSTSFGLTSSNSYQIFRLE